MAAKSGIFTEPLVTLDILQYYDTQIKNWVLNRIKKGSDSSVVFVKDEGFPETGEVDTLYVDKNGLYLWSEEDSDYIAISTQGGDTPLEPQWGSIQ